MSDRQTVRSVGFDPDNYQAIKDMEDRLRPKFGDAFNFNRLVNIVLKMGRGISDPEVARLMMGE